MKVKNLDATRFAFAATACTVVLLAWARPGVPEAGTSDVLLGADILAFVKDQKEIVASVIGSIATIAAGAIAYVAATMQVNETRRTQQRDRIESRLHRLTIVMAEAQVAAEHLNFTMEKMSASSRRGRMQLPVWQRRTISRVARVAEIGAMLSESLRQADCSTVGIAKHLANFNHHAAMARNAISELEHIDWEDKSDNFFPPALRLAAVSLSHATEALHAFCDQVHEATRTAYYSLVGYTGNLPEEIMTPYIQVISIINPSDRFFLGQNLAAEE